MTQSSDATVLVAGSINMDIVATAATIPAPGETLAGDELHYYPGGKGANQAIAAARAGVTTHMLGSVGSDSFGDPLLTYLGDAGVQVEQVQTVAGASGVALIVVAASGENSIVVVPGANGQVTPAQVEAADFAAAAVGVAQFELPIATVEAFFRRCRAAGVQTVLNTAPAVTNPGDTLALADVLIFNETELGTYAATAISEDAPFAEIFEHARRVRQHQEQLLIVTLGRRGAVALHGDDEVHVPAAQVQAVDTTGAGDCFVGYLATGLARKLPLSDALALANQAAALSVQQAGAGPSMPQLAAVESALKRASAEA